LEKNYEIKIHDPTVEFIHYLFKCFKVSSTDMTSEIPEAAPILNLPFLKNQKLHHIFSHLGMAPPE